MELLKQDEPSHEQFIAPEPEPSVAPPPTPKEEVKIKVPKFVL